jgi:hypothetical protein
LIPKLFGDEGVKHEKKFVTIVLKSVVKEVEVALKSKDEADDYSELLELVRYLCQFTRSEKQLELWIACLGPRPESPEAANLPAGLLRLKWAVLGTVHREQGGQDGRLVREVFLPALSALAAALRPPKDSAPHDTAVVEELSIAARDCKAVTDNKTFAKELGKALPTWEAFQRAALRHALKLGAAGESTLALFTEVIAFLLGGGKLANAESVVEMVLSHSLYLPTLMGPSGGLKTAVVRLLLALGPAALRPEQVPLLLAAYTATLHPSDTALLALLRRHEAEGGALAQYQPLVWGPAAAKHYSAAGWKAPLASEQLGLLDREKMRATGLRFPLHHALVGEEEVEEDVWQLYDPGFLLPWLGHLCREVYLDKHMRLLDSGVLPLALSLTSSAAPCVRAAAYTLLHLLHTALSAAKLAQEKQVWLHLLSLVRNTMAGRPSGARLPCLLTAFLSLAVEVLLAPLHPLYRPVSRALLARPLLDPTTVPEFHRLHASREPADRAWLLTLLTQGVRDNGDYRLLTKSNVPKLLLSRWGGCLADRSADRAVLEAVLAMVATNYGCVDLVTRHGLLPWLLVIAQQQAADREARGLVAAILQSVAGRLQAVDRRHEEAGEEGRASLSEAAAPAAGLLLDCLERRGEDGASLASIRADWGL